MPLELVLTFDPTSLHTDGKTRLTLRITEADRTHRRAHVHRPLPADLPAERRIGVQFVRDGQVVGVAWRRSSRCSARRTWPALNPRRRRDASNWTCSRCRLGAAGPRPVGPRLRWCCDRGVRLDRLCALDGRRRPGCPRSPGSRTTFSGSWRVCVTSSPTRRTLRRIPLPRRQGDQARPRRPVGDRLGRPPRRGGPCRGARPRRYCSLRRSWRCPGARSLRPAAGTPWGGVSPFLGAHAAIARWPLTQREPDRRRGPRWRCGEPPFSPPTTPARPVRAASTMRWPRRSWWPPCSRHRP